MQYIFLFKTTLSAIFIEATNTAPVYIYLLDYAVLTETLQNCYLVGVTKKKKKKKSPQA